MVMLIIAAVLGGLVVILGAIYAYIYYTQIRPRHRPIHEDRYRNNLQMSSQADGDDKRIFHPFMILSYAAKVKMDGDGT